MNISPHASNESDDRMHVRLDDLMDSITGGLEALDYPTYLGFAAQFLESSANFYEHMRGRGALLGGRGAELTRETIAVVRIHAAEEMAGGFPSRLVDDWVFFTDTPEWEGGDVGFVYQAAFQLINEVKGTANRYTAANLIVQSIGLWNGCGYIKGNGFRRYDPNFLARTSEPNVQLLVRFKEMLPLNGRHGE